LRKEKKKRGEDILERGGEKELWREEKRKDEKERNVDVFYIRGRRRRRRKRGMSVVK
jgi:hypothetical protein